MKGINVIIRNFKAGPPDDIGIATMVAKSLISEYDLPFFDETSSGNVLSCMVTAYKANKACGRPDDLRVCNVLLSIASQQFELEIIFDVSWRQVANARRLAHV